MQSDSEIVWAKSAHGVWGLANVFASGKLYFTCDVPEANCLPQGLCSQTCCPGGSQACSPAHCKAMCTWISRGSNRPLLRVAVLSYHVFCIAFFCSPPPLYAFACYAQPMAPLPCQLPHLWHPALSIMHFLTLLAAIACMAVVDGAVLRNATSLGGVPTIDFSCSKPGDLLSGQKVTLSPDTIKGNEHVNVTAIGHLASDVNGGSVHVAVALDGIPLLSLQLDLCKTLAKVGQSCPLKAGDSKVTLRLLLCGAGFCFCREEGPVACSRNSGRVLHRG